MGQGKEKNLILRRRLTVEVIVPKGSLRDEPFFSNSVWERTASRACKTSVPNQEIGNERRTKHFLKVISLKS